MDAVALTYCIDKWLLWPATLMRRVFLRFPVVTRALTLGTIVIEAFLPAALFSPWATRRVRACVLPVFFLFWLGLGNSVWLGAFPGPMTVGLAPLVPAFVWDDHALPAWRRLRGRSAAVRHLCALARIKGERLVADLADAGLVARRRRRHRGRSPPPPPPPPETPTRAERPPSDGGGRTRRRNPIVALFAGAAAWLPRVLFFYVMFLHLDARTQKHLPKRYQFPPWVRDNTFIWMFQIHQNSWCMFDQGIRNYGGWEAINGTVAVTRHDGSVARTRTDVDVTLSLAAARLVPIAPRPYTNDDVPAHAANYGRSHRWMYLWAGPPNFCRKIERAAMLYSYDPAILIPSECSAMFSDRDAKDPVLEHAHGAVAVPAVGEHVRPGQAARNVFGNPRPVVCGEHRRRERAVQLFVQHVHVVLLLVQDENYLAEGRRRRGGEVKGGRGGGLGEEKLRRRTRELRGQCRGTKREGCRDGGGEAVRIEIECGGQVARVENGPKKDCYLTKQGIPPEFTRGGTTP